MLIKNEDPFIVTRKDNVEQEDSKSIIKSKKLNLTIENYKMDKKLLEENSHHLNSLTNSLIVPYADDEDYDSGNYDTKLRHLISAFFILFFFYKDVFIVSIFFRR